MWICLNDAFFSVVHKDCKPDEVLVRARRPGDIERHFPAAVVKISTHTDYAFRAVVTRRYLAGVLADHVDGVTYSNFKNTVKNAALHAAYAGVWSIMSRLQPTAPYSGTGPRSRKS